MKHYALILTCFAVLLGSLCACNKWPYEGDDFDNVMIFYGGGYNNLAAPIKTNIDELCQGAIPEFKSHNAILVFSHTTKTYSDYTTPNSPVLIRIYRDKKGIPVRDTVMVYSSETYSIDEQTVSSVLNKVRTDYPAKHYGLVFSSHSTGWIPPGYTSSANENNIVGISRKVNGNSERPGLLSDLTAAAEDETVSCDDGSNYYLTANGHTWVWNYEISNYLNPSWFYFTNTPDVAVVCDHGEIKTFNASGRLVELQDSYNDHGSAIERVYRFPTCNFGGYDRRKNVNSVLVTLGALKPENTTLTYQSDYETRADLINLIVTREGVQHSASRRVASDETPVRDPSEKGETALTGLSDNACVAGRPKSRLDDVSAIFIFLKGFSFCGKKIPLSKRKMFFKYCKNKLLRSKSTGNQNKIKQQKWFCRFCFIFYGGR